MWPTYDEISKHFHEQASKYSYKEKGKTALLSFNKQNKQTKLDQNLAFLVNRHTRRKMTDKNHNSYVEMASLVTANISGPVKCELIQKAQERLVRELVKTDDAGQTQVRELLI